MKSNKIKINPKFVVIEDKAQNSQKVVSIFSLNDEDEKEEEKIFKLIGFGAEVVELLKDGATFKQLDDFLLDKVPDSEKRKKLLEKLLETLRNHRILE